MKIDDRLLDSLTEQAKSSERLRMNLDLRNSPADTSQRMLNAIEPGSEVPIHRHCTTSETVVVLRGRLIEEFYDDLECRCTDAIELSADGPVRALNIPAGQWHTVRVLESGTVIMEVKDGPYIPTSPTDILTISSCSTPSSPSAVSSSPTAHTSACVSEQSVSNPTTCSTRCSSSEPNQQASFITSSQHSVSPSDASVRTSSCTSAHTSTRNSAQSVSATDSNLPDSLSLANPKVRNSKASDINGPDISDSTTCSEPCPSTETNSTDSSIFIPAPDPRAFDGGDILRQKKKQ